ncbi:unnamed protein product [Ostreobium quekettii]|uniref:C3H1-type domain-containing protein n=1 Tax=Ostreobium quekettii TaxID=121088 RepID=A0A8S1IXC8_9CHLO|nr:unnamed protein product [Ostreobium quekettii]
MLHGPPHMPTPHAPLARNSCVAHVTSLTCEHKRFDDRVSSPDCHPTVVSLLQVPHPTQICNDGAKCNRSVCFFAHSLEELRVPPHKPGFPPEWRNRRHGRSGSIGAGKEVARGAATSQGSPLLARALSVPAALPSDRGTPHKMQMSDGTWGSPVRHLPRMKSVSCPTGVDPFGSSPRTNVPPTVWSPGLLSPFSQMGGYPLSARGHRRSVDSSPLAEQSNENVAGMIMQLIDSLSHTRQQVVGSSGGVAPGPGNNMRSNSLDAGQLRALQMAAVERALSTRSSVDAQSARSSLEDHSPQTQRGQMQGLESDWGIMGGVAGVGNQMVPNQCAPFPMMSRDVDIPPGFLLDGSNDGGDQENARVASLPQGNELHPQVGGVSL